MIRKIGKIGKINIEARKKIAADCERKGWNWCLLQFVGCTREAEGPAHLHERVWYRNRPELLSSPKQYVPACTHCHQIFDSNKYSQEEKEDIFEIIFMGMPYEQ